MAKNSSKAVDKILNGRPMHKKPVRFDDGGYVDFGGGDVGDFGGYGGSDWSGGALPPIESLPDNTYQAPNSGAPSASDISGLTSNMPSIQDEIAQSPANITANLLSPSQLAGGSGSSSGASSAAGGALASLLKALGLGGSGGAGSASGLAALAGLLSAAGQYKQNSALAPTFSPPPMFGGAPGTSAPVSGSTASNGGYGPPGGYNYANYANATSGSSGTGYAPRTAVNPNIPNYYTYGQQPQATFFSSGTPPVGTPSTSQVGTVSQGSPSAMKRGGRVKKYTLGGMVTGLPPSPVNPGNGQLAGVHGTMPPPATTRMIPPRQPMPLQPSAPIRPMITPQTMPSNRPGLPPQGPHPMMRASGGSTQEPVASAGFAMSQQPGIQSHLKLPPRTGTPGLPPVGKPMATGGSRHVQGPGDGTSDSIPARLANGEYVMDAQTVSMAGNGDNGAGAKALDKFRENLRKHKGGQLAKGKMAPDAKDLMKYLPAGKK